MNKKMGQIAGYGNQRIAQQFPMLTKKEVISLFGSALATPSGFNLHRSYINHRLILDPG
jgi:hypothetical protein